MNLLLDKILLLTGILTIIGLYVMLMPVNYKHKNYIDNIVELFFGISLIAFIVSLVLWIIQVSFEVSII